MKPLDIRTRRVLRRWGRRSGTNLGAALLLVFGLPAMLAVLAAARPAPRELAVRPVALISLPVTVPSLPVAVPSLPVAVPSALSSLPVPVPTVSLPVPLPTVSLPVVIPTISVPPLPTPPVTPPVLSGSPTPTPGASPTPTTATTPGGPAAGPGQTPPPGGPVNRPVGQPVAVGIVPVGGVPVPPLPPAALSAANGGIDPGAFSALVSLAIRGGLEGGQAHVWPWLAAIEVGLLVFGLGMACMSRLAAAYEGGRS